MSFPTPRISRSRQQALNEVFEQHMEETIRNLEVDLEIYNQQVDITVGRILRHLERLFRRYEHYTPRDRAMLLRRDLNTDFELNKLFPLLGLHVLQYAIHLEEQFDVIYDNTMELAFDELNLLYDQNLTQESVGILPTDRRAVIVDGAMNNYNPRNNMTILVGTQIIEFKNRINRAIDAGTTFNSLREWLLKRTEYYKHRVRQPTWTEANRIVNGVIMLVTERLGIQYVQWLDATEQAFAMTSGAEVCDVCLSISHGGIGGRGIYRIDRLPSQIPNHVNCRCSLVMYLGPLP